MRFRDSHRRLGSDRPESDDRGGIVMHVTDDVLADGTAAHRCATDHALAEEPGADDATRRSLDGRDGGAGARVEGIRERPSHRALLTPPPAAYTTGHRYGCFEEILVTFVGHPRESLPDVVPGTVFQSERRRLRVDPTSLYVEDSELRWAATLRTHRWWWRRRATLRMFGSPSTNVTVLTLTPTRPHRLATRAFVRQGRRAMTELRDRIDRRPATVDLGGRGQRRV